MKVHFFEQPIFPIGLCVVLEANGEEMAKVFECNSDCVQNVLNTSQAAVSTIRFRETKHDFIVVYTSQKRLNGSTIAHEATHYVEQLIEYIGQGEMSAYLTGYAYDCIEKSIKYKESKKELKGEESTL